MQTPEITLPAGAFYATFKSNA